MIRFDFRNTLTNFRVTQAWLNGRDTRPVSDALRSERDHMRAIVRAARICSTPTPFAYFDAWGGV